jgi:hypothetical protein
MFELIGMPQASVRPLLGPDQRRFYALLHRLAVIFGLMNGSTSRRAQYMMGVSAPGCCSPTFRHSLLGGLVLAPIIVGITASSSSGYSSRGCTTSITCTACC